jgi:hypothetical protein
MLDEPRCFQIWGNSRVGVNRAAWELGHRVNPEYIWLDIRSADEPVDPEEPPASGLVPPEQLYKTLDSAEMGPDNPSANLAMWSVMRTDEAPETLHPLMDFLRLPAVIQEIIGLSPTSGRHGVVVVANADRIARYYPDKAESIGPLLNVWRRERVTLITTYNSPPRKTRSLYDYTFELKADARSSWKSSRMILERAPVGEGQGVGISIPLMET